MRFVAHSCRNNLGSVKRNNVGYNTASGRGIRRPNGACGFRAGGAGLLAVEPVGAEEEIVSSVAEPDLDGVPADGDGGGVARAKRSNPRGLSCAGTPLS